MARVAKGMLITKESLSKTVSAKLLTSGAAARCGNNPTS